MKYEDTDLVYSAFARCPCGAGLAYVGNANPPATKWDCADILLGTAIKRGEPGAKKHTDKLPFAFYEVKSENQPSANGQTTRPGKTLQ